MPQFVKIFALWLVKWWWWSNNLKLNWQVNCFDSFQLQSFFYYLLKLSNNNRLFVILFHCQKGKNTHWTIQPSRCHRESPSFDRFLQVYRVVKLFSRYCFRIPQDNIWLGNYFICFPDRLNLTYTIIHTTESTIEHYRIGKHWLEQSVVQQQYMKKTVTKSYQKFSLDVNRLF